MCRYLNTPHKATDSQLREHSTQGNDHRMASLQFSLARFDLTKEEYMFLFVCSEAVKSNLIKLEPYYDQRTLTVGGSIIVRLVSSFTRLH